MSQRITKRDDQILADDVYNTKGLFSSKAKKVEKFVRWCWQWHLRRIYVPSGSKPGREEMKEGRWHFGVSAPCINHPPGRATKTGPGRGTVPPAGKPFVRK